MKKLEKKEIFSIPNLMSFGRLILIPVFCWLYLTAETQRDYYIAGGVVLISSVSDLLDGWVARHFHMITELGKVLDPFADKVTHLALACCLAIRHPMMWGLLALVACKEAYMGLMGIWMMKRGKMLDGAMWFGKVCTAVLFVGMMGMFLFPDLPDQVVSGLIFLMALVSVIAWGMYIPVFRKMQRGEDTEGVKNL